MNTLLRIDAGARLNGSQSRNIADYYQKQWEEKHPRGRVKNRDLGLEPLPHLSNTMIQAFHEAGDKPSPATALSDSLIEELKEAEHVLISSPLYNLSLPSPLKSYFDYVVRYGLTVRLEGEKHIGLLSGTGATIITTRGGLSSHDVSDDFQTDYLKAILTFMGVGPIEIVVQEGTSLPAEERTSRLKLAEQKVDALFRNVPEPVWLGQISSEDKQELTRLREKQAR